MKIVVPVTKEAGLGSRLSGHFGRAPYFAVVELDEDLRVVEVKMVPNVSKHMGGRGLPPEHILSLSPDVVIVPNMGPRALRWFQEARVPVLRAAAWTVREILEAYRRDLLEELTEGCHEAKHR